MNILVIRAMALGDVLSITPITARLRQQYPEARIVVHTAYTNVFEENPHINEVNTIHEWDLVINLDGAHEVRRDTHAIDAYMEVAFNDHGGPDKSIIFKYPNCNTPFKRFAAIHPNASWANRTFPAQWWDEVVAGLHRAGYPVIVIGTGIDYCPPGCLDTRDKLPLKQQAGIIDAANVFICGASGLFILAGATQTPVVVPLTLRPPETCVPWRNGILGGGYYTINATTPCFGCDAYQEPGATWVGCSSPKKDHVQPDYACINTIKSSDVVELAIKVARP
jgi:ADP-heptose:LPS heptosyltransferase